MSAINEEGNSGDQDPDPECDPVAPPSSPTTTASWTDKLLTRAHRVLEVGSEAADVLVHLQDHASPVGLAAVGLRVVNSVRRHRARSPEEYFAEGWSVLDVGLLAQDALVASRLDPRATVKEAPGVYEEHPGLIVELGGVAFGWAINGRIRNPKARARACWIRSGVDPNVALAELGRSVWTHMGSMSGYITQYSDEDEDPSLKLIAEDKGKALPSAVAVKLHERLKEFLRKGIHRSVFVIGEAGTGKTTMLRYIAEQRQGLRLRFRLSKMSSIRPTSLIRVVEILRPQVLLIDDIDRYVMGKFDYENKGAINATPEAAEMLDPLEVFNELVPLVMASANFSKTITSALLRPGRFDEMVIVDKLDDEIYRRMLPDAPERVLTELLRQKVPVAYVLELQKRTKVLGYEGALKEMKELVARSDRVLRLIKRKHTRPSSLVGKTPRQRAALLDRRAAAKDREATKHNESAAKLVERAEGLRAKAEQERQKGQKAVKPKRQKAVKPKRAP